MGNAASIITSEQAKENHYSGHSSAHTIADTWMDFSVTTHSHYKYHRVHVNVSMPIVESFLTRHISLIEIQGYHWINNEITKVEDDEKNTACLCEINDIKKKNLISLCQEGGLFTHYIENYALPETIPPEKLFVAINFFVKLPASAGGSASAEKKQQQQQQQYITIRLSGCINRSELNIGEIQSPRDSISGSWFTHIHTLFPSPKLLPIRKELHRWWREVEQLSHVSASQVEADSAKSRFFMYSKSQSSAYRQALEAGLQSSVGQQHLAEYEEFKTKSKQAAFSLSSTVLENLFTEGEVLLMKLIAPDLLNPPSPHPQTPPPLRGGTSSNGGDWGGGGEGGGGGGKEAGVGGGGRNSFGLGPHSGGPYSGGVQSHQQSQAQRVTAVKESLKRCKLELHQSFERSLFRLATSLETHEKHAWKNFYDRYSLGKMNEIQTTEVAENLLRSTRTGSGRSKSTPRGGTGARTGGGTGARGRRSYQKGAAGGGDARERKISADFSLFSLPSEQRSRPRSQQDARSQFPGPAAHAHARSTVRSLSPSRPKTSPPLSSAMRKSHGTGQLSGQGTGQGKRRPSKSETDFAVHFADSPFDIISSSLHPNQQRKSFHGHTSTHSNGPPHQHTSSQHSLPRSTPDFSSHTHLSSARGNGEDPSSPSSPSPSPSSPLHRTSLSIVQKSQTLILNSVRTRLQCRLELYRKDKTYNFFGTFIHQAVWSFQMLLFETAVRHEMEEFLRGEYEKMMGSVERVRRKDVVALTAVQSREKVQLLSQGIVSERGMWGRPGGGGGGGIGSSTERSTGEETGGGEGGGGMGSDRSEEEGEEEGREEKEALLSVASHVASVPASVSPRDKPVAAEEEREGEREEDREEREEHSEAVKTATPAPAANKPLLILTEHSAASAPSPPSPSAAAAAAASSPSASASPTASVFANSSMATPPRRYTDLQQKHTAELNELEYRVSEKKKTKLSQFNKLRHETSVIMSAKLQTIRAHGQAGDLSPTGVILFNNICHLYQILRASNPYVDPNAEAGAGAGGGLPGGMAMGMGVAQQQQMAAMLAGAVREGTGAGGGGRRGGETEGREGRFRKLGSRGSGGGGGGTGSLRWNQR